MRSVVTRVFMAAAAVVMAVLIAACGGGGNSSSSRTISPSESAAVATAKADAQNYMAKCVPADAPHQILLGKSLLTKDGRQKFAACLAIPPASRPAFEAALLAAAEKVKWSNKDQRHTFISATVPELAAKYHSAPVPGASANIPGVSVTPTVTVSPKASTS
jgi:hypothetical protein